MRNSIYQWSLILWCLCWASWTYTSRRPECRWRALPWSLSRSTLGHSSFHSTTHIAWSFLPHQCNFSSHRFCLKTRDCWQSVQKRSRYSCSTIGEGRKIVGNYRSFSPRFPFSTQLKKIPWQPVPFMTTDSQIRWSRLRSSASRRSNPSVRFRFQ